MSDADHARQSYAGYVASVPGIFAASCVALGLLLAIAILFVGYMSIDATLNPGFDRFDAIRMLLGLPVTAAVVFLVSSPLSREIYKLMPGAR